MFPVEFDFILKVLDLAAAVVFAITGALVASRKQMDIVGFMWLAVITGVGGGTVRDVLLGVPVFWVQDPAPVIACLIAAVVAHFTAHLFESRYRAILWLDAAGMALVTIAGTSKALQNEVAVAVAVAMGVVTAALGGIIRDVVGQEPSIVMRREIYVSASALGAITYVVATLAGTSVQAAALAGFAVAFGVRVLAITRGWSLPAYKPRPGRNQDR